MKYLAFIIPLLALIATPVYAATISLAPTTVSVTEGQTFSVAVEVNATNQEAVTVQSNLSYPANLITPTAFNFAPTWIPISETGYNEMGGGSIIKTAGYPGGFSGVQTLGTVTFVARETGVATISVLSTSNIWNSSSANIFTAPLGQSQIVVSAPAAASSQGQSTAPSVTTTTTISTTTTTSAVTAPTDTGSSQGAAVAASGVSTPSSSMPYWIWAIVILVVLIAAGWWLFSPKKTT